MSTPSYWQQQTILNRYDILIIGGGLVGMFTALNIRQRYPHKKIAILDKGFLPQGASMRNAGFTCFGSVSELHEDISKQGLDATLATVKLRYDGLCLLRSWLTDQQLGYEPVGGYELVPHQALDWAQDDYIEQLNEHLYETIGVKNAYSKRQAPFKHIPCLIANQYEGLVDTGKMIYQLRRLVGAHQIDYFGGVEVEDISDAPHHIVSNNNNVWQADQVILANNGFAARLLPQLDVKPARNQVLVTTPMADLSGYFPQGGYHAHAGYIYFRHVHNRILIGGARHLDSAVETTDKQGSNPLIINHLTDFLAKDIVPNVDFDIAYHWSGILGIGSTKTPIVKEVMPNVYVAVRMGGMGVAMAAKIGAQVVDLID